MQRVRTFWQSGIIGKIVLSVAGLFVLLTVCCVAILLIPTPARNTAANPTTIEALAVAVDATKVVPSLVPTEAATSTPAATETPAPTATWVPTKTPMPTVVTNPKGAAPVDGDCPAHYRIKVSKTGVAHDLESGSYSRTNPVHCYASMKDATDAGYTAAGD